MKSLRSTLFTITLLLTTLCISAQTAKDTLAIKETALNYIEGYFYKDAERMEKALHPELVKRSIQKSKDGHEFIVNRGASFMIMAAANNSNRYAANPEGPIESVVEIYDITGNAATAKVSTNQYGFIDYLHIGKYYNEWKIVNVFWASVPENEK